jgi:PAS domain S-box-containing protein
MIGHARQETALKVLESLGQNAWQKDLQTGKVQTSPGFWEELGYLPTSIPSGEAAHKLLHPTDAQLVAEELALHLRTEEPWEIEIRVRAADGEWHFIRARGCITEWDDKGQPTNASGTLTDITQLIAEARQDRRAEDLIDTLSPRERQVLICLLAGAQNKNIAYGLGLSQRTVEGYRARLMEKLHVRSVSEATQIALAAGLTPDEFACGIAARAG